MNKHRPRRRAPEWWRRPRWRWWQVMGDGSLVKCNHRRTGRGGVHESRSIGFMFGLRPDCCENCVNYLFNGGMFSMLVFLYLYSPTIWGFGFICHSKSERSYHVVKVWIVAWFEFESDNEGIVYAGLGKFFLPMHYSIFLVESWYNFSQFSFCSEYLTV